MKPVLVTLLALCALTAAFVPRIRRAADPLNVRPVPREICAPQTPCAWSVYRPNVKMIEINITNNYCECAPGLNCVRDEDDVSVHAYILRCRTPEEEEEI